MCNFKHDVELQTVHTEHGGDVSYPQAPSEN